MDILVVDDQADIREILTFIVNHEFKANIVTAISGNTAVDILKTRSFEIVICDYNMPDGNGLVVHDYIKTHHPKTKFIFCTSETEEVLSKADNVFYHIKKPNVFFYIQTLKQLLSESGHKDTTIESHFNEISLHLADSLSPLPFDLYLRLADNNYVKYFSKDHHLTKEELTTVEKKGVHGLFVRQDEMSLCQDQLLTIIKKLISIDEQLPAQETMAVQDYVSTYFKQFGNDPVVQEMAIKNLKQTIALMMREKEIEIVLVKLLELGSYSRKLYAATVCFSAMLLRPIDLLNDQTLSKMISAIYLQDVFVPRLDLLSIFTKFDAENLNWPLSKEKDLYYHHPLKASEFVKKTKVIAPDVDRLIMESHELPSGEGFPRGLTASQISPLSCILILSNLLAREFLRFETAFSTAEYLQFLNRKHGLEQGNFKKVYDAALSIDFFPRK